MTHVLLFDFNGRFFVKQAREFLAPELIFLVLRDILW